MQSFYSLSTNAAPMEPVGHAGGTAYVRMASARRFLMDTTSTGNWASVVADSEPISSSIDQSIIHSGILTRESKARDVSAWRDLGGLIMLPDGA